MVNVPYPGVRRDLEKISRDVSLVVDRLEKAIAKQAELDQHFVGLHKKAVEKKPAKKPRK